MHEEHFRREVSRRKNEKKKVLLKGIMIIFLCITVFIGVRESAEANNIQTSLSKSNGSDWKLLLINKDHMVPDNFGVELVQLKNGQAFDKRAYPDLQAMMDDARAAGLSPLICSSYRTMKTQTSLFNNKVNKNLAQGYSKEEAKTEAGKWVALPGTSEHQIGLAVDIISINYQVLDKQQESTKEQIWLMENSYKYGFILRYPENKSEITGISYEPWHYRYVGKEAAAEITQKGLCLEEYLQISK